MKRPRITGYLACHDGSPGSLRGRWHSCYQFSRAGRAVSAGVDAYGVSLIVGIGLYGGGLGLVV
jgi:hypothetical protein